MKAETLNPSNPTVDDGYRAYADLLLQHHRLLLDGENVGEHAEIIEEGMTGIWDELDPVQRRSLAGLGSDLSWVRRRCRLPERGRRAEDVTKQDLQALGKVREDADWHGVLHQLRLCAPKTPPTELATLRALAWTSLSFPQIAGVFRDVATELQLEDR